VLARWCIKKFRATLKKQKKKRKEKEETGALGEPLTLYLVDAYN
jgi:hypothetical protein